MPSDHEEEGSKRQRVSRACDLCRKKKIKCDGSLPVCSNCKAFDLECTYKDTTKKRGPPKGYIEAIENRLYKLESLLGEMAQGDDPKAKSLLKELNAPLETPTGEQILNKPQRRSAHGSDRGKVFFWQNAPVRPKDSSSSYAIGGGSLSPSLGNCIWDTETSTISSTSGSPVINGMKSKLSPASSGSHGNESVDTTGQLAMDANGQYRYLGKSSGFYLLQKSRTYHHGAFHLSGNQQRPPQIYGRSSSASLSYFSSTPSIRPANVDPYELPSPQLSTKLVRLYLEHFYPVLPIFYKRQLSSSLDDPAEPISPLLLNAIYAVASRICDDIETRSDPARQETSGEVFFERAKCLLDSHYDIPRISTVQALLLLSIHQQGTMKSARAWLYSGMAFRMALDLGLNRNCDHWQIPPDEKERRKRVFWCAYVCDVMASATFGRSSTFEESDCDIPFPSIEDDEPVHTPTAHMLPTSYPPPGPLMVLSHLVKICDILGHVLKNIYYAKALKNADIRHIGHVVSSLTCRLSHWYKNLPPALCLGDTGDQSMHGVNYPICVAQLHMVYHTTVILLHRLFIPNNNTINASPESISEYKTCAISATAIMNIANSMLKNNMLKYVFHSVVYCIFTAGIIFINSASCSDATKSFDAKVNINNIMRLLETLEKTWTSASRSANILGELAGLRELNLPTSENTLRPIVHQRTNNQSPPIMSSPGGTDEMNMPSSAEIGDYGEAKRQPIINDRRRWNQHTIMTSSLADELDINSSNFNNPSQVDVSSQGLKHPTPGKGNMDPFAAPDTIPVPSQRQFDISGTAFWGVPPSLDLNEWNQYLGTQLPTYQQQQLHQQQHQQQQQHKLSVTSSASLSPTTQQSSSTSMSRTSADPQLISSRNISSHYNSPPSKPHSTPSTFTSIMHSSQLDLPADNITFSSTSAASSTLSNISSPETRYARKHLIHGDSNVDVLSGMPIPLTLSGMQEDVTVPMLGFSSTHDVGTSVTNTLDGNGLLNTPQDQCHQQDDTSDAYGSDAMVYY